MTTTNDEDTLVEMRIRYDIPDDAADQVGRLAESTLDLRTNLEAAARFNGEQVEWYRELLALSGQVLDFQDYVLDKEEATAGALERQVLARNSMNPERDVNQVVEDFTGRALPPAVLAEPATIRTTVTPPTPDMEDRAAPDPIDGLSDLSRHVPTADEAFQAIPEMPPGRIIEEYTAPEGINRITPPGESGDAEEGLRFMQAEYATEETLEQVLAALQELNSDATEVTREDLAMPAEDPLIPPPDPELESEIADPIRPEDVESGGEGFVREPPADVSRETDVPTREAPADVSRETDVPTREAPADVSRETDVPTREAPAAPPADQRTLREALTIDEIAGDAADRPIPVGSDGTISFTRSEIVEPVLGERGIHAIPDAWETLAEGIPYARQADGFIQDTPPDVIELLRTFLESGIQWLDAQQEEAMPGATPAGSGAPTPGGGAPTPGSDVPTPGSDAPTLGSDVPAVDPPPRRQQITAEPDTPEGDTAEPATPEGDAAETRRSLGERVEELGRRFRADAQNTSSALGASDLGDVLGTAQNFLGGEGLLGAAPGGVGATLGSVATRALPWVGGAYLAYQGVNALKEQTAELTSLGMESGGGLREGMGYQMAVQQMALNPMLTTQQSKQIVMTALSEGYTGKEFDTMTQFMADNMTEMNLSVNDSVKLLKSNVEQGGQSVKSLGTQLEALNATVGTGVSGRAEIQEAFVNVSQTGVDLGMGGSDAGRMGMVAANLFQDQRDGRNNILAGRGGDLMNALANSQSMQVRLGARHDIPYWEVPDRLGSEGTYEKELLDMLAEEAKRPAFESNPEAFRIYLQQAYGLQMNRHQATQLREQLVEGNILENAENQIKEAAQTGDKDLSSRIDESRENLAGNTRLEVGALGRGIATPFVWTFGGGSKAVDDMWRGWHEDREKVENYESGVQSNVFGLHSGGSNPMLETLVRNYGTSNLFLEEDGERVSLDDMDFSSDEAHERISSGRIVVEEGGQVVGSGTLEELAMSGGPQEGTGAFSGQGGTIGLTPEASKLVTFMQGGNPTQNQLQSWSGANAATLNDPPVGDR